MNSWLYGISWSPSLNKYWAPFFCSCFPRTGSRDGSSYYYTFSIKTICPFLIAFSKIFKKLASLSLVIWILWSLLMFLIHLLAWPWGSIINGHLLQLKMKIPLSVDKESVGKPCYCQSLIWTSSERILSSK